MLRDRIARARPAWTPDMPNYHAILGMHAFGLEETGHYARAEATGREAIALYLAGVDGRLMRSLKSLLGSSLLQEKTAVPEGQVSFQDVIARFRD